MFEAFVFKGLTMEPGDLLKLELVWPVRMDIYATVIDLQDDGALIVISPQFIPYMDERCITEDEVISLRLEEKAIDAVPHLARCDIRRGQIARVETNGLKIYRGQELRVEADKSSPLAIVRAASNGLVIGDVIESVASGFRVIARASYWRVLGDLM